MLLLSSCFFQNHRLSEYLEKISEGLQLQFSSLKFFCHGQLIPLSQMLREKGINRSNCAISVVGVPNSTPEKQKLVKLVNEASSLFTGERDHRLIFLHKTLGRVALACSWDETFQSLCARVAEALKVDPDDVHCLVDGQNVKLEETPADYDLDDDDQVDVRCNASKTETTGAAIPSTSSPSSAPTGHTVPGGGEGSASSAPIAASQGRGPGPGSSSPRKVAPSRPTADTLKVRVTYRRSSQSFKTRSHFPFSSFKCNISKFLGLPAGNLNLKFHGSNLRDQDTFAAVGVRDGDEIEVVVNPRSGLTASEREAKVPRC